MDIKNYAPRQTHTHKKKYLDFFRWTEAVAYIKASNHEELLVFMRNLNT